MNPKKDRDRKRLYSAIEWSRRKLRPFREHRLTAIKEYVGSRYSEDGAGKRVYLNLIEQAVNTYARQLAASRPKVLVTTRKNDLRARAYELELACNHLLEEINFVNTLRHAVIEGMFSVGIVKVGMSADTQVEIDGFLHDVGQPFADIVTLDHWCHDMSVNRWDQISFAGNQFRVPLEEAKENKEWDAKVRKELKASSKSHMNEGGDATADSVSQGASNSVDEYADFVDLWEIWLPRENKLMVVPSAGMNGTVAGKPLSVEDWEGPEGGPFHRLSFAEVPGNVMGLPTVALLMDLHELVNSLYRKLSRQAQRQKDVFTYPGGSEEDARRVAESSDGETIRTDNPAAITVHKYSTLDQSNLAFAIQSKSFFSEMAGNLDTLAGLRSEAPTLGQERLLSESSHQRVADMQERTVGFARGVIRDLAAIMWYSPMIDLPISKEMNGEQVGDEIRWPNPEQDFLPEDLREGDFFDYNLDVEPYSMQHHPPAARIAAIDALMMQVLLPGMQMIQEQGKSIDFGAYMKIKSKYMNLPELEEIVVDASGEPTGEQVHQERGGNSPTRQAPVTRRENVRINQPGASKGGAEQVLMNTLMGGQSQPDERAGAARGML